jgi:ParB-like nuclease domain
VRQACSTVPSRFVPSLYSFGVATQTLGQYVSGGAVGGGALNPVFVPLTELTESLTNPRKAFDDERLEELAESIRIHGILSPLFVPRERTL